MSTDLAQGDFSEARVGLESDNSLDGSAAWEEVEQRPLFSNGQLRDVSIASFIYLVNVLGAPTMCLAPC